MNDHETIFDRNLERLLSESYQPENPDPAFVADLEERMRALAMERALRQLWENRLRRLRLRLGVAFGLAAAIATIGLFVYAQKPPSAVNPLQPTNPTAAKGAVPADGGPSGLTAARKPAAPAVDTLAIGSAVKTEAGDRRRLVLPDGSILFLNEKTSVRLDADRRLKLEAGEVYVEVAPKDGDHFVVAAPGIEAVALGTKFVVDARGAVTVTQGKVRVNGLDSVVNAGQQLLPSATEPTPAPRATALLDWVRDIMLSADSPLIPKNQRASKLVAFNPNGQEAQISLRKFHVDVHIEDGFARTTIDETYFNHENVQLEGTFHFPLPPDASLSRLAMYVNGDLMEGGMAERSHARNVYEEIRYNVRRDPALLEWVDGSTFKMRVFPMEARQEKRIVLSYTQRLAPLNGKANYRFPMGHTLNETDFWSVNVRVKNAAGINWASPSHPLSAVMDGRDLLLSADAKHAKLDRDLQLNLTEAAGAPPVKFSARDHETDHYLMLRYRPNAAELHPAKVQAHRSKHYLFLFEASADRDPLLARTQIEVIRTILDNLEHDDTFSVLAANTRARTIVSDLTATPENIKKAVGAMERVHLIGALDLDQSLSLARESLTDRKDAWLVHVGSGVATLGERREDVLAKRVPGGVRYAGIGVGKRWSRSLMKAAADRTGGHFAQINPDEAVTWKAFDFLATLRTPRWQNLRVADDQDRPWLLHDMSLAAGEELCAAIRVGAAAALPKSVTIRGIFDDKPFEQKIDVANPQGQAGYLPRDWAKLEIDRLLAEDSAKNKSTIVELSKAMYVISPFTSLLVLEDEAMYKRFNVDRGRKDHWAMYPCPAKIPVVYEPAGGLVNTKPQPKPTVKAKTEEEILKSILIRGTPALVTTPGQPALPTMTAWERYQMQTGQPMGAVHRQLFSFYLGYEGGPLFVDLPKGNSNDNADAKNNPNDQIQRSNNDNADRKNPIDPNDRKDQKPGDPKDPGQGDKRADANPDPKNDAQANDKGQPQNPKADPRPDNGDTKNQADNKPDPRGQATEPIRQAPPMNVLQQQRAGIGLMPPNANYAFGGGGQFGQFGQMGFGGQSGFGGANGNFIFNSVVPQNGQVAGTGFGGGQGGFGGGQGGFSGQGGGQGGFGGGQGGFQGNFSGRGLGFNPPGSFGTLNGFQPYYWTPNGTRPPTAVAPAGWMWQSEDLGATTATVRVRDETVAGAMILPGSHVDVVCVTRLPTGKVVSETILQNKLVLAVNRDHETTLAVTPQESRRLHAAAQRGEISFGLRNRDDDPMYVASLLPPARSMNQLLYQRPAQGDVQLFFRDLVAFAPGLNTTDADVAAVLEAEAAYTAPATGTIDEDARKLLAKAAGTGWRKVKIGEGDAAFTAECNGAGRFAFQRTLPTGLTERVVCDGTTLWHLYPDLGLAGRRPFSRYHAAEWRALVPWVVPPIEQLVRGADVVRLSDTSVAIVPRGTAKVKNHVHLTFGDNGLLRERTVVEMPSKKVVSRVQFDAADYGDAIPGPTITGDVSKSVVLNLPYRTLAHVEATYGKKAFGNRVNHTDEVGNLNDAELVDFLSASFAEGYREKQTHGTAAGIICYLADADRRYADKRPALFVLLRMVPTGGYSDVFTPTGHALVKYLNACSITGEMGRVGQDGYFLQTLARLHDIYYQWHQSAGPDLGKDALARLRDFVERNRNGFGYAALVLAAKRNDLTQDAWRGLAEAWQLFDHDKTLGWLARFERMRCFLNGGMPNTARLTFDELYRAALDAGELPPLDDTVKKLPVIDDGPWGEVLLRAAGDLTAKGRPGDAMHLAWQALALGEPNLALDLVGKVLPKLPDAPPAVILDAVAFLANTGKIALAQELIQPLLEHPRAGQLSEVWRTAADLAGRRNQSRRMVEYLDRALELEFERMPAEFDVRGPRAEYAALLAGFQQVASAHKQLETLLPAEFVARAVRAADRWRALDSDPTQACHAAARLLRELDQPVLAWDYLTSPVAFKPNEADPFKNLAQELVNTGDAALAEKAYAAAFAAEPTNAELLWLRVGVLRQLGKEAEAQKVLKQIADGDWQPRFDWMKRQAQQTLGR